MREESFPIDENLLQDFIEVNTKIWHIDRIHNSCNGINKRKYVYINLSMVRMQMAWVISKLIAANCFMNFTLLYFAYVIWANEDIRYKFELKDTIRTFISRRSKAHE